MSEHPGTAAPAGRAATGRPSRRLTVLAAAALSAALAGTTRALWVRASAPDLAGTLQQVEVRGAEAAPAVLALALVALAAALATSLSSRWVRFVTGPVLLLSGLGAAGAALGPVRDPAAAATGRIGEVTGMVGAAVQAEATLWPLLTLAPALAVAAAGVVVLWAGGGWSATTRYRSAAAAPRTADPAQDPAAAWDALSRGEDPSREQDEDEPER